MGKEQTATKIVISGRVQGVGYRYFAERWAHQLGIRGYVENRADGCVEVYAVGAENAVKRFRRLLAEGPPAAVVTDIEDSQEIADERYADFTIRNW